jgi:hypothetical protein
MRLSQGIISSTSCLHYTRKQPENQALNPASLANRAAGQGCAFQGLGQIRVLPNLRSLL